MLFLTLPTPQTDSDRLEELLSLVAQNDKQALAALYGITKEAVYGFALSILKNPHEAEDAMQNAYVRIWQNAGLYQAKGKPMAWVLTVTKNLCYMRLREQKKTTPLSEEIQLFAVSPEDTAQTAEDKALLAAALAKLHDEERQIVMLHAVSGLKFREIARLLDLLTPTVLSKYRRAMEKMRRGMEEQA